ncbi:hypothetical protein AMTRI_Chr02g264010 [Amborella trichopoda]|uniref:uncharacterized protein LOC18445128 n=1 Tax=Amborella trichopoda TaxID=13333 RepID=UPI0005D45DF8|nr:uncharacterized protein LOC18445128 [Amborella trichopoda]|eukprot:XP_011627376.1 uncharacterized protein LOC18445128 [Amborella trichopoda]
MAKNFTNTASAMILSSENHPKLLASVDMGSNSFKMVLVRAEPSGRFLRIDRHKEPVSLGRYRLCDGSLGPGPEAKTIEALNNFMGLAKNYSAQVSVVATAAIREAINREAFLRNVEEKTGVRISLLSGEEEARLIYLGVLQFLPLYKQTILTVDIGGGSTEFVVGCQGKVLFATSLKLGHIDLTETFIKNENSIEPSEKVEIANSIGLREKDEIGKSIGLRETVGLGNSIGLREKKEIGNLSGLRDKVKNLRQQVRLVLQGSPLVKFVENSKIERVVGTSGTIKAIAKAIYRSHACNFPLFEESEQWGFGKRELGSIIEKLCSGQEDALALGFSLKRSESILAGSVLLLEIFEVLGIHEMEVSPYALGEGVIAESLASTCLNYDVNANIRWHSVMRLAYRFNGKKRMRTAIICSGLAKEIFEGLKTCYEMSDTYQTRSVYCFDGKDYEYLEAAILLHGIGHFIGKKGYHKHSYRLIKNSKHLYGYNSEEREMIALLARYHRKKYPRYGQSLLEPFPREVQLKIGVLCAIIRISLALQRCQFLVIRGIEISKSHEGYQLILRLGEENSQSSEIFQMISTELEPELQHFSKVLTQKICIVVSQ